MIGLGWQGGVAVVLALAAAGPALAGDAAAIARGGYLAEAGGCGMCHTGDAPGSAFLAGGRAIKTRFGTFFTPNISPDPRYGIGGWSDADFLKAMRAGVSPDGTDYYPAFPYTSFTLMSDRDILDIKAYLFAQPPVPAPSRPHDLDFPYSMRLLVIPWKILYFREGPLMADLAQSAEWNRGAYLARAVGHCGECHTPRNALGAPRKKERLGGVAEAADGRPAPDITPHAAALGRWSVDDLTLLLRDGVTPDGDVVRAPMADVVRGTSHLSEADRRALALYIKTVPPVPPPAARN